MQFIIRAYDFTDKDAPARRMAEREAHLACIAKLKAEGKALFGAALLDEAGNMRGSLIVCDFPTRAEVDAYVKGDPYVTGRVWEKIDIEPCKVAPSFTHK
jgi:hypothetical protein